MKKIFLLCAGLLSVLGLAQDGSPDYSFGNNGFVETDLYGFSNEIVYDAHESYNGRIIVVGYVYDFNQNILEDFIIAYNENGSIDTSFGVDGLVTTEHHFSEKYFFVETFSNEEILIGKLTNGTGPLFYKYSENGQLDENFGMNGALSPFTGEDYLKSVNITEDDKILFLGWNEANGNYKVILKKYLTNGTLDEAFGDNGVQIYSFPENTNLIGGVVLMSNNKFILSIKTSESNTVSQFLAKFLANGSLDDTFGNDGTVSIPIDSNYGCSAKLIPGIEAFYLNCSYYNEPLDEYFIKIAKLTPIGNIDPSFGNNGYLENVRAVIVQPNSRFIHVDAYSDWEGGVIIDMYRRYGNGNPDPTFNFIPIYSELEPDIIFILRNSGKLLIVSTSAWYNGGNDIVLQQYHNNPLGLSEFQDQPFILYPNPSRGILKIESETLQPNEPYQISDACGKVVHTGVLEAEKYIDLSALTAGVYFFEIGHQIHKLIKL